MNTVDMMMLKDEIIENLIDLYEDIELLEQRLSLHNITDENRRLNEEYMRRRRLQAQRLENELAAIAAFFKLRRLNKENSQVRQKRKKSRRRRTRSQKSYRYR